MNYVGEDISAVLQEISRLKEGWEIAEKQRDMLAKDVLRLSKDGVDATVLRMKVKDLQRERVDLVHRAKNVEEWEKKAAKSAETESQLKSLREKLEEESTKRIQTEALLHKTECEKRRLASTSASDKKDARKHRLRSEELEKTVLKLKEQTHNTSSNLEKTVSDLKEEDRKHRLRAQNLENTITKLKETSSSSERNNRHTSSSAETTQKLKELEETVSNLKEDDRKHRLRAQNLENTITKLKETSSSEGNDRLRQEELKKAVLKLEKSAPIDTLKRDHDRLTAQLKEEMEANALLKAKLADFEDTNKTADSTRQEVQALKICLDDEKEKTRELEYSQSGLEDENTALKDELKEQAALESKIAELEARLMVEVTNLENRLEEKEAMLKQISSSEDASGVATMLATATTENEELRKQLESGRHLNSELDEDLVLQIRDLESKQAALMNVNTDLLKQVSDLETQLAIEKTSKEVCQKQLNSKAGEEEAKQVALMNVNTGLMKQIADLENRLAAKESSSCDLKSLLDSKSRELSSEKAHNEELRKQFKTNDEAVKLQRERTENDALQKQILSQSKDNQIEELQSQLKAVEIEARSAVACLKREIEQLKNTLIDKDVEDEVSQGELADIKESYAVAKKNVKDLSVKNIELQLQIDRIKRSAEAQLHVEHAKAASLESELAAFKTVRTQKDFLSSSGVSSLRFTDTETFSRFL
eukprot:TRINITY_DN4107_c0_g2_i1.p1 TRINITY_DN4107_c0_g2~~TRINITY_DN4107_c0_g2_i1.p1  ORF type:complete len:729 (+),score=204.54 TRINITY_DN4107_c0_g2_i1:68-2188(+)